MTLEVRTARCKSWIIRNNSLPAPRPDPLSRLAARDAGCLALRLKIDIAAVAAINVMTPLCPWECLPFLNAIPPSRRPSV